ncbi:carbohydrate ABC transporter permease [Mycoplasma todarodis]|nr:carbohydrate ABC transporter permease [Mycoplasma todarodis]
MSLIKLRITNFLNKRKLQKVGEATSKMPGATSIIGDLAKLMAKVTIIGIFGLLILFPFYYMISGALMSYDEISDTHQVHLAPKTPHWENFTQAFQEGYWNAILLTALVTFLSIVIKIIITLLLGYAFSLPKWRGKKAVWFFFLSIMMLPEIALMSGQYTIVTQLDWREGPMLTASLFIPFIASVFSALMLRNAFEAIPSRTKEAAMVDGCSSIKYFFRIAIPMVTPTIWTVGILTAFAAWNSYMWPALLLANSADTQVMSTWLFTTGKSNDANDTISLYPNVRLAAAALAIIPMFLLYFGMRGKIMRTISRQGSAIKG